MEFIPIKKGLVSTKPSLEDWYDCLIAMRNKPLPVKVSDYVDLKQRKDRVQFSKLLRALEVAKLVNLTIEQQRTFWEIIKTSISLNKTV
jgi:hypothetical protein